MWWVVWLIAAVVLLLVEFLLPDPVTVWFGLSAAVVWLLSLIFQNMPWYWEVILFVVLSIGLLVAMPPRRMKMFLKKIKRQTEQETDFEYILKHIGVVQENVNNDLSTGLVKINGVVWSARSVDNTLIEKGSIVTIDSVDGNKLYVKKKEEEQSQEEQA